MFVGLEKPLVVDVGDSGTPLTADEREGDLERRSEVRRSWGVALVYKSRVLIGNPGCGKAGDRVGGASAEWFNEPNRGLRSGIENIEEFGEK
jgi:hypothetical protein